LSPFHPFLFLKKERYLFEADNPIGEAVEVRNPQEIILFETAALSLIIQFLENISSPSLFINNFL